MGDCASKPLRSEESSDEEYGDPEKVDQSQVRQHFRELSRQGEYSLDCSDGSAYVSTLVANYMLLNAVNPIQNIRRAKKCRRRT